MLWNGEHDAHAHALRTFGRSSTTAAHCTRNKVRRSPRTAVLGKTLHSHNVTGVYSAAGMFEAVRDSVKGIPDQVSVDMSDSALEMLRTLAFAHAQRCWYDSAILKGSVGPKNCAILAAAAADYYYQVHESVHPKNFALGKHLNNNNQHGKWEQESMVAMLFYRAAAQKHEAIALSSRPTATRATDLATELLRLESAEQMLQTAAKQKKVAGPLRTSVDTELADVTALLAKVRRENDTVFNVDTTEIDGRRRHDPPQPILGRDVVAGKQQHPSQLLQAEQLQRIFAFVVPTALRDTAEKVRDQCAVTVFALSVFDFTCVARDRFERSGARRVKK